MRYRGAVEHVSRTGLRGWAAVPGDVMSVQVAILVDGIEEARLPARLPRDDVRQAGFSVTGLCGFEFIWQTALPDERHRGIQVLVGQEGEELPWVQGGGSLSLYRRFFDGSFGVDNTSPETAFLSAHYTRHNARRLEHLASLRLPLYRRSVVEFGAGVGDHSSYYLDRRCEVLATDARADNLALLQARLSGHPRRGNLQTMQLDVEADFDLGRSFEVVHCYGLLYHLFDPAAALARMARHCDSIFLLETKTDPDEAARITLGQENAAEPYHSFSGRNARPSRAWIMDELQQHFAHVQFPLTTPSHEEFPLDWSDLSAVPDGWPRTIVVASRKKLDHPCLGQGIPTKFDPA